METIGISCSCSNTEAFKLSDIAAECTRCSTVHTITDEPVFITRSITPLHVLEQHAKDKALEDIHQAIHLELWLEEQSPLGVDWSTCFDVDNITVNIPEECCVYHDGMWYNPENPKAGVINADAYGKPIRVAI